MTVEKLTDTITRIGFKNGTTLTLIGTAHISENSTSEVKKAIEEINPDRICIELDKDRWDKVHEKNDEKGFSELDLVSVIKNGKTFLLLANLILASFQKRLNLNKSGTVGEEIISAGDTAIEKGIPLTLADRSITVTLQRVWRLSKWWSKMKMLSSLLASAFDKSSLTEEEIDEFKKSSNIEVMLSEVAKELPEAKSALIDERDKYLATKIYEAEGTNKIAVVGQGHTEGLIKTLENLENGEKVDTSELERVPQKTRGKKLAGWIVPILLLIVVLAIGVFKGWQYGVRAFVIWAISNALTTFVFSILSLSHPVVWFVGAITAPIAALTPVLGVGMFTGIVQARLKKPLVKDLENMTDDVSTFKGWFKNRVLHVFTVFILTSVGSTLGTLVVFPILTKAFGG